MPKITASLTGFFAIHKKSLKLLPLSLSGVFTLTVIRFPMKKEKSKKKNKKERK